MQPWQFLLTLAGLCVAIFSTYFGRKFQRKDIKDFYYISANFPLTNPSSPFMYRLRDELSDDIVEGLNACTPDEDIFMFQLTFQMKSFSDLDMENRQGKTPLLIRLDAGRFLSIDLLTDDRISLETRAEDARVQEIRIPEYLAKNAVSTVIGLYAVPTKQTTWGWDFRPKLFGNMSDIVVNQLDERTDYPATQSVAAKETRGVGGRLVLAVNVAVVAYVAFSLYSDIRHAPNWEIWHQLTSWASGHSEIFVHVVQQGFKVVVPIAIAGLVVYLSIEAFWCLAGRDSKFSTLLYSDLYYGFRAGPLTRAGQGRTWPHEIDPRLPKLLQAAAKSQPLQPPDELSERP